MFYYHSTIRVTLVLILAAALVACSEQPTPDEVQEALQQAADEAATWQSRVYRGVIIKKVNINRCKKTTSIPNLSIFLCNVDVDVSRRDVANARPGLMFDRNPKWIIGEWKKVELKSIDVVIINRLGVVNGPRLNSDCRNMLLC
jgi:hypothetical protein